MLLVKKPLVYSNQFMLVLTGLSIGCVLGFHRCRLLKCHDAYPLHNAYGIRWKSMAYGIFAFMGQRVIASRHALWVLWFYAPLKVSWTNLSLSPSRAHTHLQLTDRIAS